MIHNKTLGDKYHGNYPFIMDILKCLGEKNPKMLEKSKDYLRLYYEGITEGQIEMAFLKFWILSEKIFKGGEMVNDEKIVNLLKKLVGEKHTKERIENLYKKRNAIVHEMDCKDIFEKDRDLSKLLSESLIRLFIDPPAEFKNYPEFKFILDNIFLNESEKKTREEIIKKLI